VTETSLKPKLFDNVGDACKASFMKLGPVYQLRNPVMFVVYIGAVMVTALYAISFYMDVGNSQEFMFSVTFWLWFTVLFANFAESVAEGRGKAQAASLRQARKDVNAKKLRDSDNKDSYEEVDASTLRVGDVVVIEAGDFIPCDAQVIKGVAFIDESAITGESAPVIRESGGDRDSVTAGTRVLSDWLIARITTNPGESFIDKMIALIEGAKRQKTPNETVLAITLASLSLIFVLCAATLLPFSKFVAEQQGHGAPVSIAVIIALLVCLVPTTVGGLLSAIGIAGMNRLVQANVIATSGRAVEAAGDVSVLLLDKTGTITHGNRQAVAFMPVDGATEKELAEAAELSSIADETPEGKSIVTLARNKFNIAEREWQALGGEFIPFSADTRVSGINIGERHILKGAGDAVTKHVQSIGGSVSQAALTQVEVIARQGGTPLLVADGNRILGVVHLKDVVKSGIRERLAEIRRIGIKSVMITGDNPLTAAAIASEAGVDDFVAQATPEMKLKYIRKAQENGELVAMVGDGTNDAPALAQADVAVAMNSGTQAAKEAGNMVDLDSNPTKLLEIVQIGKQLLMTRGALTTFSIMNDIAKYFATVPAALAAVNPRFQVLDILHLSSPESAILSTVIFNAVIIIFLIPLAMRGIKFLPMSASEILRRNMLVYGVSGLIIPFVAIKLIDMILVFMGLI